MIIYYQTNSRHGPRLTSAVEEVFPAEITLVCNSLEDVFILPDKPTVSHDLILLLAEDMQELARFTSYKSRFWGLKLILILPDKEATTLSLGCALFPKYIAETKSDFRDIQEVLKKMLKKYHEP